MTVASYILSPFVTFIESHLHPDPSRYAVFHRLTGQLVEFGPTVRSLLQAAKLGSTVSIRVEDLSHLGEHGRQIRRLIEEEFFIPSDHDALSSFVDHYVVRPLQNPAVTYRSESGEVLLASISMAERIFSPESAKLPPVVEERMSPLANELFLAAEGSRTLREIHATLQRENQSLLEDQEFRLTVEFLTAPERQLIKLTPTTEHLSDPTQPANIVPRNFYHASRWTQRDAERSISDFHVQGIDDAIWEFDIVEPTVNHALRFPTELLGGLDYGSRFFDAVLQSGGLPAGSSDGALEILEVGGGTGSFARSFIARAAANLGSLSYQILDLSPALAESQRRMLNTVKPAVGYIAQDATQFDLPGQKFDLIIANEVIADFPVAIVERRSTEKSSEQFAGEGAVDVREYGLSVADAPNHFYVTSGVFRFLERAWMNLAPGGALIVSEYGSESRYSVESFHLNHSEFSIHFGHVTECARKIGFKCRLETLKEFLGIDDRTPVLNGREEHIRCLNHVFEKYGMILPFALFSERDFKARFADLPAHIHLEPLRFLPLASNFYYGPNIDDFLVLIAGKPIP
jgi:phospholipid N-methyltransferase